MYASYQVSVDLANRLQKRRFKCEKVTEGTQLLVRGAKNVHVFLLKKIGQHKHVRYSIWMLKVNTLINYAFY